MKTRSLWQIFKDMLCEDNGNGSGMRGAFLIGQIALWVLVYMIVYYHYHATIPENSVRADIDLLQLGTLITIAEAALMGGKVLQKGKEQKADPSNPPTL